MRFGQFAVVGIVVESLRRRVRDTRLDVEAGWGGHLRSGRWTPVFVSASGSKLRTSPGHFSGPDGGSYTMRIQQAMTIDAIRARFLCSSGAGLGVSGATFTWSIAIPAKPSPVFPMIRASGQCFPTLYADSERSFGITGPVARPEDQIAAGAHPVDDGPLPGRRSKSAGRSWKGRGWFIEDQGLNDRIPG